jgi:soluble lytic murein transglycosylase-like protein
MLGNAAHLVTAALLLSAALSAVDHSFVVRECLPPKDAAGVSPSEPPSAHTAHVAHPADVDGIPYQELIQSVSQQHGVPAELVASVIRLESNFNPDAVSPRGARGLMQLMPETAAELGVRNILDVEQNIEAGVRYLRGLLELFSGDVVLAVAAYNAGAEVVKRYGGIPPYPETQRYVERVLRVYWDPRERLVLDTATGHAAAAASEPHDLPVGFAVAPEDNLGCPTLSQIGRGHDSRDRGAPFGPASPGPDAFLELRIA